MADRIKNDLGQYFTPRDVADLMVGMLTTTKTGSVLEPSSGEGVFLTALYESGYRDLVGVEVDPKLAHHAHAKVDEQSFVTWQPACHFDAVLGNPPYIRWRDMNDESKQELQADPLWGELFNALTDYLIVFIAKAVEHLKEGGELVFITPRFWMHTKNSEALRNWLLERGYITDIVDFEEAAVFPKVSSSIIIFRFVKTKAAKPSNLTLHRYLGPRKLPAELSLEDRSLFEKVSVPQFGHGGHWTLADENVQAELDNLENACKVEGSVARLGEYVDIANGLVSGLDTAFRAEALDELSPEETLALADVLKAKNMVRGASKTTLPYMHLPLGLTEQQFETDYPHFYKQLSPLRADLEKRHSYTPNLPYWEWAFPRSASFHFSEREKVMVPCKERLTNRPYARFTLAPAGSVATQDVTALAPKLTVRESAQYIAAYLTLPEVSDWIRTRGLMKGGVAEFSERPLTEIPFRSIDWKNAAEVALHDEVAALMGALSGDESLQASELLEIHAKFRRGLLQ